MIASVRGEVTVRRPDHVVIECGGVGYRLSVSAHTLRSVPAAGYGGPLGGPSGACGVRRFAAGARHADLAE